MNGELSQKRPVPEKSRSTPVGTPSGHDTVTSRAPDGVPSRSRPPKGKRGRDSVGVGRRGGSPLSQRSRSWPGPLLVAEHVRAGADRGGAVGNPPDTRARRPHGESQRENPGVLRRARPLLLLLLSPPPNPAEGGTRRKLKL